MKNSKYGVFKFPCFTQEQVKTINDKIKENIFQKEDSSYAAKNFKKGNFSFVRCVPLMEWLHPWLYQCQQGYKEIFGYDIYWHFHLDTLNYNVYGINDEYGWHKDASGNAAQYDIKLTCMLNLSEEPYEGGEFKITGTSDKIIFNSGEGLLFNSLVAHKVTPVTKGKRITLSYWATGPTWR